MDGKSASAAGSKTVGVGEEKPGERPAVLPSRPFFPVPGSLGLCGLGKKRPSDVLVFLLLC